MFLRYHDTMTVKQNWVIFMGNFGFSMREHSECHFQKEREEMKENTWATFCLRNRDTEKVVLFIFILKHRQNNIILS